MDDQAGQDVANAIVSGCPSPPVSRSIPQDDGSAINSRTGQPVLLGELLVSGGGSFKQRLVGFLETSGIAPVKDTSDDTTARIVRQDGTVVVTDALSSLNQDRDYAVIELVRAPNGTLALVVFGLFEPGTRAGAWYFVNVLTPQLSTTTASWFVVEWQDGNGDHLPDAADTWTVRGSGS